MPKHTDGFIGIWPADVLYLLKHVGTVQFYRLADWPQLFHRCSCCKAEHLDAYREINDDDARQWAEERING